MRKNSKKLVHAVWVALLFLTAALAYRFIQSTGSSTVDTYRLGDRAAPLISRSMENEGLKIEKGKWYLIVLSTGLERNFSFVKYIDHLSETTFSDPCLRFFVFDASPGTVIARFREENGVSIPILPAHENREVLERLFKPPWEQRAVRLIDSSGKISFAADFIRENDVRQILEKHLRGNIDYQSIDNGSARLKTGDFFLSFNAIDIKSGAETVVDKELSPRLWFIFTARCVSCALKSSLSSYSSMEAGAGLLSKLNIPVGLIFSPYFNPDDINRRLAELKIQAPAYLSRDELEGIENSYYRTPAPGKNVIVTITGGENKILYLETFQVFTDHLNGDYFEKNEHLFH
jgi:hypothetical protein